MIITSGKGCIAAFTYIMKEWVGNMLGLFALVRLKHEGEGGSVLMLGSLQDQQCSQNRVQSM